MAGRIQGANRGAPSLNSAKIGFGAP